MKKFLVLLTLWCTAITANAALISIDIEDKVYDINDRLTANIYISEFNDGLSGFEFDLVTMNSLLAFEQVNFGTQLDIFFGSARADNSSALDSVFNSLSVSELSFETVLDLQDAQLGLNKILLASVDFNVLSSGLAALSLANFSAADVFSDVYQGITAQGASVQLGSQVSVPEPSSMAIFALALLMLVRLTRKAQH